MPHLRSADLPAIARLSVRTIDRRDVPAIVGLGIATGLMSIAFLAAVEHIPLGTAVAIEFLGHSPRRRTEPRHPRPQGPAVAFAGVVLVTRPWEGDINLAGVGFAAHATDG